MIRNARPMPTVWWNKEILGKDLTYALHTGTGKQIRESDDFTVNSEKGPVAPQPALPLTFTCCRTW